MTVDDQDAEVGRLVRERRDLRAHHQALLSRTDHIGKLMSSVGKSLNMRPSHGQERTLKIEEDGAVRVSDEYHPQQLLTGKFPTADEVRQLLREIKDAERQLGELETKLKAFGV
jgi:hypothetical protein